MSSLKITKAASDTTEGNVGSQDLEKKSRTCRFCDKTFGRTYNTKRHEMNCSVWPQLVSRKDDTVDGEKLGVIDNDSDVADTMVRTATSTGNDNENVIDGCAISLTAAAVKKRRFDPDYLRYNREKTFWTKLVEIAWQSRLSQEYDDRVAVLTATSGVSDKDAAEQVMDIMRPALRNSIGYYFRLKLHDTEFLMKNGLVQDIIRTRDDYCDRVGWSDYQVTRQAWSDRSVEIDKAVGLLTNRCSFMCNQ